MPYINRLLWNKVRDILIDWFFQDTFIIHKIFSKMPLASKTQVLFKLLSDCLLILTLAFSLYINLKCTNLVVLFSIICGHTINWFIFGHMPHYITFLMNKNSGRRIEALHYIASKLRKAKVPSLLYGSLTQGRFNESSDIDIFIIAIDMQLKTKLKIIVEILIIERLRLFFKYRVPMDVDIIENIDYLIERCSRRLEVLVPIYTNDVLEQTLKELVNRTPRCVVSWVNI